MRRVILIAAFLFCTVSAFAQDVREYCNTFNDFNTKVLKGGIKKEEAIKQFQQLTTQISDAFFTANEAYWVDRPWVFPLQGYNYRAIGGTNGNGYYDKGYHYLDGNKHIAHPAHDIFINDRNQDCIDDHSHQPVSVLAVDYGVVIACTDEWDNASDMRGGKYIWIYHSHSNLFTYYAHNRTIFVKPGDKVKPGQKIAEVGRTGYNAYKKRSPTHLHFSAFHLINGLPVPYNCYLKLKNASKS